MTETTTGVTTADDNAVMLRSGVGWGAETGKLELVPNWYPPKSVERTVLLGLAPYSEPLGVAETGSTSEMNTVVTEAPVLVATTGVTVKLKVGVDCNETADPFPGVPVSMSDNVDV